MHLQHCSPEWLEEGGSSSLFKERLKLALHVCKNNQICPISLNQFNGRELFQVKTGN
jgi:hypothetical protein